MCWSRDVSLGFALAEASSLICLWRLSDGFARPARHLIPLMVSICVIELVEACIWNGVLPSPGGDSSLCDATNRFLTRVVFANLAFQPLLANLAALRLQPKRELFRTTSVMAAALAGCFLTALALGEVGDVDITPFEASGYLGMHGTETCSFAGARGHLHWVFKTSANFMLPNGFAYVFMMLPPLAARPSRLLAAPLAAYLAFYAILFVHMGYSFEAGSVWCWSAIGLHVHAYVVCSSFRPNKM